MEKIILLCLVMVTFSIVAYGFAYTEDYPLVKDVTFSADYAFYTQYVGKGFTWEEIRSCRGDSISVSVG